MNIGASSSSGVERTGRRSRVKALVNCASRNISALDGALAIPVIACLQGNQGWRADRQLLRGRGAWRVISCKTG